MTHNILYILFIMLPSFSSLSKNVFDLKHTESPRQEGGEAIAAGGFGCVFRPALKCKGEKTRPTGKISKLLEREDAIKELNEIKNANRTLKKIPNFQKYFAIDDYTYCTPEKLEPEDQINMPSKCDKAFKNIGKNQKKLNQYRILSSPDLGISLRKYFNQLFKKGNLYKEEEILQALIHFNKTYVDFLNNGISKMSSVGFFHGDVKADNIMVKFDSNNISKPLTDMKLIDYGLSFAETYNSHTMDVNSAMAFNYPLSAILFNSRNLVKINKIIDDLKTKKEWNMKKLKSEMTPFVKDVIKARKGHLDYIIYNGTNLYSYKSEDEFVKHFFEKLLTDYLCEAIFNNIRFNSQNMYEFDTEKYYKNVYRYNLDVWGYLTAFLNIASTIEDQKYKYIKDTYFTLVRLYLYNVLYANRPLPIKNIEFSINTITLEFQNRLDNMSNKRIKTPNVVIPKPNIIVNQNLKSVVTLLNKRCPNGYKRHPTMENKCIKKTLKALKVIRIVKPKTKTPVKPKTKTPVKTPEKKKTIKNSQDVKTLVGKRCPNGYKRHATMKNKCVKK